MTTSAPTLEDLPLRKLSVIEALTHHQSGKEAIKLGAKILKYKSECGDCLKIKWRECLFIFDNHFTSELFECERLLSHVWKSALSIEMDKENM